MQPTKCVAWSSQRLDHSISLPPSFFILHLGFRILGALVESKSFKKLFVLKVLNENLEKIFNFILLADHKMTFAICITP
jgi:hypothetical protein